MSEIVVRDRLDDKNAILRVKWTDPSTAGVLTVLLKLQAYLDDAPGDGTPVSNGTRMRAVQVARELAVKFYRTTDRDET